MRLFQYLFCLLFYGHETQELVHHDIENRITLWKCTRCKKFDYQRMWFDDWWHLISDEERVKFMDEHRYDPLGVSNTWSEWKKKEDTDESK